MSVREKAAGTLFRRADSGRKRSGGVITPESLTAASAMPGGLALVFDDPTFSIHLCAASGATLLTLGPYRDEEVIAVWRSMAAASGLPLLVAGPDGALGQPYPQLGRLLLGTCIERRRLRVLSGRRPRFLVKRKGARMPTRPLVRREREIVAGGVG